MVHFISPVLVALVVLGCLVMRSKSNWPSKSASPIPFGKRVPVRLLRVSDGDTIVVANVDPSVAGKVRVRFRYIDAPETSQPSGREATQFLKDVLSSDKKLTLTFDELDMYGRALAVVYKGRRNVNKLLLAEGHAWCYRNKCPYRYMQSHLSAKERRLGIWKQSNPESPWEYRRKRKYKRKGKNEL